jgi:3-oxoadipate enol-lactonase
VSPGSGVLAHELAGSGPALLLVHAGIADRRMWDDQMEPFAGAGWTVIRADLPGVGGTPAPSGPVATWATLRDLLDHLGVEQAAVVGCSLGGRAAVDLALAAPGRVRALVLVGSGLGGHRFEEAALHRLWDDSDAAVERGDLEAAARIELETWVAGVGRGLDAVDPEVRSRARAMLLGLYGGGEAELEDLEPPAAGRLGEITAPTLVLVGDHDRADIQAIADALAGGIPGAERAVLAGTAHLPNMERPGEFNRVVLEFLAGLDRSP